MSCVTCHRHLSHVTNANSRSHRPSSCQLLTVGWFAKTELFVLATQSCEPDNTVLKVEHKDKVLYDDNTLLHLCDDRYATGFVTGFVPGFVIVFVTNFVTSFRTDFVTNFVTTVIIGFVANVVTIFVIGFVTGFVTVYMTDLLLILRLI